MAVTRKIIKRRIGPDGVDINCETDADIYFDLKDDKKTKYEQGRGRHYRKTIYSYRADTQESATRREYIDPPLEVKNSEDEAVSIEYQRGVIKHYWLEAGRGSFYRRAKIRFDNTEENTRRKVRVQRVNSSESPGDYVEVERVKSFRVATGRGNVYQVKQVNRRHEEEEIEQMDGPCKTESSEE